MCFYNDYDWYADISETTEGPLGDATCCDECGSPIKAGEWRRHVFMQQHEECRKCEWEDGQKCEPGECDYGETYNYDCCRDCATFRDAIRDVEEANGCKGDETQPALGQMYESVSELWGDSDVSRYLSRAFAKRPTLRYHGHIKDICERVSPMMAE